MPTYTQDVTMTVLTLANQLYNRMCELDRPKIRETAYELQQYVLPSDSSRAADAARTMINCAIQIATYTHIDAPSLIEFGIAFQKLQHECK